MIFAERGLLDSGTHAFDWTTRLKIALNIAQGNHKAFKIYPLTGTGTLPSLSVNPSLGHMWGN
jgi:hypothetical protein